MIYFMYADLFWLDGSLQYKLKRAAQAGSISNSYIHNKIIVKKDND